MIKNICCLLLVAIISGLICWNMGFISGRDDINDRLVVTSWSDGYMQGHCEGGTAIIRVMFGETTEWNSHKLDFESGEDK